VKQRIDLWLVENGYFESREKAQRAIMAGLVTLDGKPIDKPGQAVTGDGRIEVASAGPQYVSRGAHKLAKGLAEFGIQTTGRICLDAGASTGGFTDLLLQSGAAHVFAVDVGYGQLAWKLRQDSRVTVFERENIRFFAKEKLAQLPDLITADLSFISLELVIPVFAGLCRPDGDWVTLIKPQFEAGREKVGKKGVVRDPAVHRDVLERIVRPRPELGWSVVNLTFSPLPGPEGNIEYLGHWRRIGQASAPASELDPARVVAEAWESLREKI
jgi:23S rRNA (cytidine1920-2'-O)/16S rRNA (cytidine1409-2'-O)-methyltransferase